MVRFLVERPVAVMVSLVAFLVLGLVTVNLLPVSLLPAIDIPDVTVQVSDQDLAATDLERSVVSPMRQHLLHLNGLEDIESRTTDGQATIALRFGYGTDIDLSAMEVNEQIDAMMTWLPDNMERPRVIKASASDIPVFDLTVSYRSDAQQDMTALSEFAHQVLRRRLEQLPAVAMADMSGAVYQQITITPQNQKLQHAGLTLQDITDAFTNYNASLGTITLRDGHYQYAVNVSTQTHTPEAIGNMLLQSGDRLIRLKEVANISLSPQPQVGALLINGHKGIVFSLIKNNRARMQDFESEIADLLKAFQDDYPHLVFGRSRDQSQLLNVSMVNLQQNLLYGVLLAFALMFFVLGSVKEPFLMGITIPASLIVTMLIFYLAGISINIISLSGLILGAGMMIDNSIIVIDNISQHRKRSKTLIKACTEGTNEVIRPLISSVLTTCAVFLPLIFLSDMSGALFFDQAVAIAIGLTVSLLVSVMVIPVLYHLVYKKTTAKRKNFTALEKMTAIYEKGLHGLYSRKGLTLIIFLLLIPAGMALYRVIPQQLMPRITHSDFKVTADWNESISLDENLRRCRDLSEQLQAETKNITVFVGEQQFLMNRNQHRNQTSIEMVVESKPAALPGLKSQVKQFFRQYPRASFAIENTRNVFEALFNTSEPPLTVKVRNLNGDLPEAETIQSLQNHCGVLTVEQAVSDKEVMLVDIDFSKLLRYQVDYQKLVQHLQSALQAYEFGEVPSNQRMIPVVLSSVSPDIRQILSEEHILNDNGYAIPLRNLITLTRQREYKTILADDQGTFIPMVAHITNKEVPATIRQVKEALSASPGLSYTFAGEWFKDMEMLNELLYVLAVSMLLLYFILAAQFESLVQPLIVLTELFIDISGALLLLWIFGLSLNVMSAIGIIVMSGIIINDSIIKIDTINRLRASGMPTSQAVYEAGYRRFNPIIMTSLTTILALIPLLFGSGLGVELQRPLAVALIGGMAVGTVVSLYLIPVMYGFIYDRRSS
jgi:multidrug efflux pump subunit AcrB